MKTIKIADKELVLIEVPEDAHTFKMIHRCTRLSWLDSENRMHRTGRNSYSELPCRNLTLLGKGDEIREDVAETLVEELQSLTIGSMGYRDYNLSNPNSHIGWDTATQSLASLILFHSMKPETTILLSKAKK